MTPDGTSGPAGQQPAGGHVDSEQLALLAMGAPTAAGIAEHVAACPACAKDLSVLRSLLAADGPDGAEVAADTETDLSQAPPAAALQAQADGNDSTPLADTSPVPAVESAVGAGAGGAAERHGNPWLAVAVVAAVFLAIVLLAFLLLR